MRKSILLFAAAFIAVLALTGCEPDTETSNWLKNTTWKADLSGKQFIDHFADDYPESDGTVTSGEIVLRFTGDGYRLSIECEGGLSLHFQAVTKIFPDYKFPKLLFPVSWSEKDGKPVDVIYETGIFSEDLKTLHFDSFRSMRSKFGSYYIFKDVDFTRK